MSDSNALTLAWSGLKGMSVVRHLEVSRVNRSLIIDIVITIWHRDGDSRGSGRGTSSTTAPPSLICIVFLWSEERPDRLLRCHRLTRRSFLGFGLIVLLALSVDLPSIKFCSP